MRLTLLILLVFGGELFAFDPVTITSVSSSALEGPIHHGIVVETNGIKDPNLSFYEVQIKPDTGGPFPPWQAYNTEVMPFDGKTINLPYRNGLLALAGDQTYCIKVRGVYGSTITPWTQRCGIVLEVPPSSSEDSDGDGISDEEEFALGTDPQSADSDGDGIDDATEIADGSDPNEALFPNLILRTVSLDFGEGDPLGQRRNQHQVIEIENIGDDTARISELRIVNEFNPDAIQQFHIGSYNPLLTHIPPENTVRIPVSFLPLQEGPLAAHIEIFSNNPTPVDSVTLTGTGVEVPGCRVTPEAINFGTVSVSDQSVKTEIVTIENNLGEGEGPSLGFTLSSTVDQIVPAVRGYNLFHGEKIEIPILFRHTEPGTFEGFLEIRSNYPHCGLQRVVLRGRAE